MVITGNIQQQTKLNALFWFAGVGGRAIIFIVPWHITVTNCWPGQNEKKKKIKKYKRKEQKKNEREMIDSSRKQQQQQKKKNKKSCVIGTDLDRRWCRRRWFRKEPIGRRWLYPFVGPRKCRIIKLTTYQQHWRERRHWRCWPLTERRTVCAAAAVASIRAIATYSS